MLLIGDCAGAMVCSKTLKVASNVIPEPMAEVAYGLGLIDFEIWPHYDKKYEDIKKELGVEVKVMVDGDFLIIE